MGARRRATFAGRRDRAAFRAGHPGRFMTPLAGDIISAGAPPGVGMGMKPPRYLKAGDRIELEIEGPGRQRQTCIADPG